MQGYSVAGFLNAVMRRSNKTLLVEGVTDQSLITRLKRERGSSLGYEPLGQVDQVSILSDPALHGLGNKEKIKAVLAQLSSMGPFKAAIEKKFGTLTDREWDGVVVDLQLLSPWQPPTQSSPHFTTLGHSVENYFLFEDAIEAYLNQAFSDHLKQEFFNELKTRFYSMVAVATTYSLALRRISSLSKADGMISRIHVEWDNGKYHLRPAIDGALSARTIPVPGNFYALINSNIDLYYDQHKDVEPGRWLCHGHLGEQAIWACVASLAEEHNVTQEVVKGIERGSRETRFKHSIDFLSRSSLQRSVPLESTLNWLTAEVPQ